MLTGITAGALALASAPPAPGPGPRIPVLILTGQSNTDWHFDPVTRLAGQGGILLRSIALVIYRSEYQFRNVRLRQL